MPIKTILLHMANDERHGARIETAVALAKRFDAFVEVLYIASPVTMPAAVTGRGASYAFLAEATAIAHEKAEEVEREVRAALKDCSYSWTVEEGDHVEQLAARAVYADLAIVTQSHPAHLEDRVLLQVPDRLPLEVPCPTLVLPYDQPATAGFGKHIVVAWKNVREASLAVRNAMTFLTAADRVTVLTLEPPGGRGEDQARDIMVFLERHGVRTHHQAQLHRDGDVGEAILDGARQVGADMLVMGCYGHSRLREMVLGGATRTILRTMHIPALMSH
ncbi:universal stress protein [Azospirillum sp. RWY-5-1]|uniref:Universal stress protein n=1 Tax=Azospirillum oleiclasticum TaxID=2735135 RepID=A0ABX2T4G4_9PROT|nr:universal stress protein [Azospirillum oleiclasticum]NYZ12054.1 universal stress protein [Azospirillum oleiclasticum]NYZ19214.1 universal stress protein [Azospirillum oleiclasticum]